MTEINLLNQIREAAANADYLPSPTLSDDKKRTDIEFIKLPHFIDAMKEEAVRGNNRLKYHIANNISQMINKRYVGINFFGDSADAILPLESRIGVVSVPTQQPRKKSL